MCFVPSLLFFSSLLAPPPNTAAGTWHCVCVMSYPPPPPIAYSSSSSSQGLFHQAILGDLNTMAHGVARLSPRYCTDRMRALSLGTAEAVVWERHVLCVHDPNYSKDADAKEERWKGQEEDETIDATMSPSTVEEAAGGDPQQATGEQGAINARLLAWGVPAEAARAATNPGFRCPFPAASTITLDNPKYRFWGVSLMRGKLDWVLLRRLAVVERAEGNVDYALSDHKWLSVDVAPE
jgi:hypothetical protein